MDGEYFHNFPHQKEKDNQQMKRAKDLGYNIIRITDNEIKNNKNILVEVLNEFKRSY